MIKSLQASLRDSFHMKDLGPLHYFLGLEVHQSPNGLFINQYKYAIVLIELADLNDSSSVDTPLEVNLKLSKDDGDFLPDPHTYRRLVDSLVYLTITSQSCQQFHDVFSPPSFDSCEANYLVFIGH